MYKAKIINNKKWKEYKCLTSVSKNLVNNELIRFGGSNSIRGFDDKSIFADGYTLLATNLNFYLNDTIYIYGIFDLANYTNSILDLDQDIYSGGIGFSTLTENGVISINNNDISLEPMYKRAKQGIGYLAQEASVFRKLTVEQNIVVIWYNIFAWR